MAKDYNKAEDERSGQSTTTQNRSPESPRRKRRSPKAIYDYEDMATDDDDIYALLALSDNEYSGDKDYDYDIDYDP